MREINNIKFRKSEQESDKVIVTISDDPMNDIDSCSLLNHRNNIVIDEIISEYDESIPFELTSIQIDISAYCESNLEYYSFLGIENLLRDLLQTEDSDLENEISNSKVYFKVYYVVNELLSIPTIRLEILFLNETSDRLFNHLFSFLNSDLFMLIGSLGKIERKTITHPLKLKKIMSIPMLLGFPSFKHEGIYSQMDFTSHQLKEMNQIFAATIMNIDVNGLFKMTYRPFDSMRNEIISDFLEKEENEKIERALIKLSLSGKYNLDIEKGDMEELRYIINKENSDDEDSGLPF